ncbi:YggT family protein [Methylophilus medardicus]|uniref:YggT family protein n=1 Tax=Methylophilus medardicus TaxID=2588534 RepID=A0A5B8CRL1_9PROT|nr:YggT family protein [Methylophilus medardicus]QDC43740.1 YggT family protein [Methylophilus medardicus]QDC48747.1 YggT family protein [Methylophilus medardicus]QDC52452.1 YggT family protein [Methylophilus medardicus]
MLQNMTTFLLNAAFGILTFLLVLRFLMQWTRTAFQNPLGQMSMALTDFMVKPARRLIRPVKQWDLSTLILALCMQIALFALLALLAGAPASPVFWLWQAVFGVLGQIVDVFFYAILLMAILSWVNPYSPIYGVLNQLSAPIVEPLRRLLPPIQGFDFSALVALILLQMLSHIVLPGLAVSIL